VVTGGIQMLELPPFALTTSAGTPVVSVASEGSTETPVLQEKHFKIHYGETGHSYESIIGPYLVGAKEVVTEDAYVRATHQVINFVRFCEAIVKCPTIRKIRLVSVFPDEDKREEVGNKLQELKQSLLDFDVELEIRLNPALHDREIHLDTGWIIKIGRGLDFYQKPENWNSIGVNDLTLRKCLETKVDIYRAK